MAEQGPGQGSRVEAVQDHPDRFLVRCPVPAGDRVPRSAQVGMPHLVHVDLIDLHDHVACRHRWVSRYPGSASESCLSPISSILFPWCEPRPTHVRGVKDKYADLVGILPRRGFRWYIGGVIQVSHLDTAGNSFRPFPAHAVSIARPR